MTPFQTGCKFNILTLNTAGLDSSLKVNVMPTESFEVPLMFRIVSQPFFQKLLTSSMRTPKPIIKQWCDPLMTFHKHCSCYSLLTLR